MHNNSKIAAASIAANTIAFTVFSLVVGRTIAAAHHDLTALVRAWGVFFALQIAVVVGGSVLIAVIIQVLAAAGGERGFEEPTDERDRHIDAVATKWFGIVFSVGFLAGMVTWAFGAHMSTGMWIIAAAMLIGQLVMNGLSIVGYERGF